MNQATQSHAALRPLTNGFAARNVWRVVIADDESLPAELLRRILVRLGYTVVGIAQNGTELLQLTRQERPDVVVMDLRMPEMDGWTAMAELTRELATPIVVVSALDDRESLEQAVSAGASAFLTKPVRADDLERALELAVARAQELQESHKWRAEAERSVATQAELARTTRELTGLRAQLADAGRRAAVSSLAYNLTHEINNALTPIIGNAQLLSLSYGEDADAVERVNQIVQSARRIADWIGWFQQLVASDMEERITFSLNGVLRDTLALYRERFERLGIQVTVELDDALPALQGQPAHLQQVWMTLLQNALDGLRGGGTLQASTQYLADERAVLATLTDSGVGIASEGLPHVFEPEYAPRRVEGSGSRLDWGFFAVQQIIHAHGGTIAIVSPPEGKSCGTQVRFTLPLNAASA